MMSVACVLSTGWPKQKWHSSLVRRNFIKY